MPIAVGKAVDLVLDRRTIPRASRADRPREQRRAIQVGANDVMAGRVGAGNRAKQLRVRAAPGQRGHAPDLRLALLHFQPGPVDGPSIQPRRCPGLEPGHRQGRVAQLCRHALR